MSSCFVSNCHCSLRETSTQLLWDYMSINVVVSVMARVTLRFRTQYLALGAVLSVLLACVVRKALVIGAGSRQSNHVGVFCVTADRVGVNALNGQDADRLRMPGDSGRTSHAWDAWGPAVERNY
ncbi:hypothetical protein BaRGS_00037975 [Batillaria attramentaria]|uniref:Uncharacterized protein n=1 Tax=Batillaria attramentaria TaxID=370345 RepID=A0ABD0J735_9CAEN